MLAILPLLRAQHVGLQTAVEAFLAQARAEAGRDPQALRAGLGPLAEALETHLRLEDEHFYPWARAHEDTELAALATRYWSTMGSLRELVAGYLETWSAPGRIEGDPEAFLRETDLVMGYLLRRVEREDRDLYPRLRGGTERPPHD